MAISLWCVLAAALIPYVFTGIAKSGARDNYSPRVAAQSLTGFRQRAYWAQQNGFEVFPPFAAAVIINYMLRGPNAIANELALTFIALRVIYGFFYLQNLATFRSLSWALAIACIVALFVMA